MGKNFFITDFDGTLLKNDKTISREDIKTLEMLRQRKIVTAIATGRSVYSFEKALKVIGMARGDNFLPVDYVIFSTGAGIMEFPGGKVICQKAVPSSDIGKITNYLDHRKFDYMVHKSIPDTRHFLYKSHGNHNPDFQARLALYKEYALPLKDGHIHCDPATEVLAIIPGGADMDSIETIKKDLSGFSVIHATSPLDHLSSWIEVFHKDVSKAKAASWLVKRLGVNRQNVISVGNDYNDQDLLAWSGKGFVVENAPDRLRKAFKTVSSNNRCGVSQAVKESGWID
ncbi:HAD family hydrolase [Desulfobacula sp.]|uniref:HAD family hydrolase n=1 Tax=Desulfobacula sp. TaxID=2593537 RepID=UPI00262ED907|nr:HAD family hydrolase [Desulfobacula sp.]